MIVGSVLRLWALAAEMGKFVYEDFKKPLQSTIWFAY
jgi:hypothetical protein